MTTNLLNTGGFFRNFSTVRITFILTTLSKRSPGNPFAALTAGASAEIDDQVVADIAALSPLAPLHQPPALELVRSLRRLRPELPAVACFDITDNGYLIYSNGRRITQLNPQGAKTQITESELIQEVEFLR